ncbi:hypothetical protein S7711_02096 [Stachybotrys chartarum IBT 7711]|uniref:XPG-I domain-containing protein n=1 Tax=Stachybotrys chartarum (strain CBS 109288 / IBT 7711) TaxID=1280523 RepID=A0A084ARF6_STACB|nr:hypothetical protein S7711_02096 [Stachybotrys chartarum IBT 7711]
MAKPWPWTATDGFIVPPIAVPSNSARAKPPRSNYTLETLCSNDSVNTRSRYVNSAMHRVKMMQHFGVTPYMVFDGDFLPSKAATEQSRAKSREEKKKLANELLKAGKTSQAMQEFQKCIDITPEMASAFIRQLKKLNVPYVVAPYEADAQLVYLERQGLVNGIISEDSDLLVFGAKRLLTKLDQYGNCIEINRRDFCAVREISLTGWTDTEFRRMAIMSGCDYLGALPGVGLKTAYRLIRKTKSPERIVKMLQFQGKRISENYLTQFYQAELTFLHQWVFCPQKKGLVHLTDLDGTRTAEEMPFIGAFVEPEIAQGIARGDINPITKTPIVLPVTPSKRRHSQTSVTVVNQPPMKPISTYFKNHNRIPMGEMDPNCFAIDSQRVAEITEGGYAPRVFPLPRPYLDTVRSPSRRTSAGVSVSSGVRTSPRLQRRRTEPISNLLSSMTNSPAPLQRNSSANTSASPAAPPSKPEATGRPPKKARLCDDLDEEDKSPKNSKFFPVQQDSKSQAETEANNSPSLSDESIEEVLHELPDIDGWRSPKKPRRSIAIFDDAKEVAPEASATADDGKPKEDSAHSVASNHNLMLPPKSTRPLPKPAGTPSSPNLRRFSYSSHSSATPASSTSRRSSIFSAASTPSTAPSSAASRLTPLQRIGFRALNTPGSPKMPMPRKNPPRKPLAGLPINPAFVPLPKVDVQEVHALNRPCGSEDHIIPDSDEEDDEEMDGPPTKLNLSRFAFA